jgi:hypothetical protein
VVETISPPAETVRPKSAFHPFPVKWFVRGKKLRAASLSDLDPRAASFARKKTEKRSSPCLRASVVETISPPAETVRPKSAFHPLPFRFFYAFHRSLSRFLILSHPHKSLGFRMVLCF